MTHSIPPPTRIIVMCNTNASQLISPITNVAEAPVAYESTVSVFIGILELASDVNYERIPPELHWE